MAAEEPRLTPDAGDTLFAYFSQEVLARCSPAEQAFLVATAPLATFTLAQAQALTGREDAEEVLETLRCGQFFVTRLSTDPPSYRCHPLFHEFLRHEARRTLTAQEWLRLRLQAAALAESAGAIATAAALCIEYPGLERADRAPVPVGAGAGDPGPSCPTRAVDRAGPRGCPGRSPRGSLYWLGTARVYAGQTRDGRALLECAYRGFASDRELHGMLLAWGGIIESYSFEWDDVSAVADWTDRIQAELPAYLPGLPAPVVARLLGAGMALEVTQRAHPVTRRLVELAGIALGHPDLEMARGPAMTLLLIDRLYGGDFTEAQAMLDMVTGAPGFSEWPPLARMLFLQFEAACAWQTGHPERTHELVERVLTVRRRNRHPRHRFRDHYARRLRRHCPSATGRERSSI